MTLSQWPDQAKQSLHLGARFECVCCGVRTTSKFSRPQHLLKVHARAMVLEFCRAAFDLAGRRVHEPIGCCLELP